MTRRIRDGGGATIRKSNHIQVSGQFKRFETDGSAIVTVDGIEHRGILIPSIIKSIPLTTEAEN